MERTYKRKGFLRRRLGDISQFSLYSFVLFILTIYVSFKGIFVLDQ